MSKKRQLSPARAMIRPGEGTLLDVTLETDAKPSGSTVVSFGVDLAFAPVPDRKYVADMCSILQSEADYRILFGQTRIDSSELRSLLVVHMSVTGIQQVLQSFERMKNPTFEELIQNANVTAADLSPTPTEPSQTVALAANMATAAMSGLDACIDFYRASPFAVVAAPKTKKLALDPIVRVDTSTALVLGIVSELRKLSGINVDASGKEKAT